MPEEEHASNLEIKAMLVGELSVGKTSLVRRFVQNEFHFAVDSTIGIDFSVKTLQMGRDRVRLQIWDTGGQERFQSVAQQYYYRGQAFLLVSVRWYSFFQFSC